MDKKESDFVNKLLVVLAILVGAICVVFFVYIIVNIVNMAGLEMGAKGDLVYETCKTQIMLNALCLFGSAFIGTLIITILYIWKSKRKIRTEVDFATTNIDEKILNESVEKE